ncbi:hypothetical protein [Algibacillus agarilyticus]|uniref:hypothetical protein n=1 Tax=Algibacillus agarilyticus TaxID=2234133 RepID=UPI000DD0E417|nr:hypothetical protein [Algibacillus agarilyticus]
MDYKLLVSACLGLLLLSGCQSTAPTKSTTVNKKQANKPDWLYTTPLPRGEKLYAVGHSVLTHNQQDSINAAQESARAELAKLIKVVVSAETNVQQEANNQGDMAFYFNEAITNTIPAIELKGLTIDDQYIDEQLKTAYVLVSFNKADAIADITRQIGDIDENLSFQSIKANSPAAEKLKQAGKIKSQLLKRAALNNRLTDFQVQTQVLSTDIRNLQTQAEQVFTSITFSIEAKTDKPDDLFADKLAEVLTQQGLKVTQKSRSTFNVIYNLKWRELTQSGNFYSFAVASVKINEQQNTVSSLVQKAKGVSSDAVLAQDKAIEKLAAQFSQAIAKALLYK